MTIRGMGTGGRLTMNNDPINKSGMSRRRFLQRSLAAGGAAVLGGGRIRPYALRDASSPRRRPNVVLIVTDDQNFNTIGAYGAEVLTPHIDGLGGDGIRFTRAYTTSAVCVASRYGCLTGRFPSRNRHPVFREAFPDGVQSVPEFNTYLEPEAINIARVLKRAGYATGVVGKWHLGRGFSERMEERGLKPLPESSGYKSTWTRSGSAIDPRDAKINKLLEHNHEVLREEIRRCGFDYAESFYWTNPEGFRHWPLNFHNMEWVAQGALNFMDRNRDNPFFLYMNTTLHHIPHPQVSLLRGDSRMTPAGYLDRAPDVMPPREGIVDRVEAAGFLPETAYCTWLDDGIGAVLNGLKTRDLESDTLVILFSDNGTPAKGTLYEGGVNVPCLFRWKEQIPPGQVCRGLAQNLDFAPTIFEACGVDIPSRVPLDGKSLLPMLTGRRTSIHRELFFELGWTRAVCTSQWKYLALRYPPSALEREKKRGRPNYHAASLEAHQHNVLLWHPAFWEPDQLYDLADDPREVVNLAADQEHKDVLEDLKERMGTWLKTFGNHPFGEFV
jgi:arylsulfatase A-like enzyme